MNTRVTLAALGGLSLAAAGCAAPDGGYPSLAKRDGERMVGSIETPDDPSIPPPAALDEPLPADLATRLAAISTAADAAHARFLSQVPTVRSAATDARDAAPASRSWASAQVALASLESARSDTMFALADLDSLMALGSVAAAETGDATGMSEIGSLHRRVVTLVAQEDAILDQLRTIVR